MGRKPRQSAAWHVSHAIRSVLGEQGVAAYRPTLGYKPQTYGVS